MIYEIPNLINKTGADFIGAFKAIPKHPTTNTLNLGHCNLGAKKASDIIAGFVAIPPNIEMIHLDNNELSRFESKELIDLIHSIPNTVIFLSLAANGLNTKAGAALTELLKTMKPNIRTLNLKYNELVKRPHNRKSSQPENRRSGALTLSGGGNKQRTVNVFSRGESLAQFTLPGAAFEEPYELSRPPEKAAATLAEAFRTMSYAITFLNISYNGFYHLPSALLNKVMASLPASLISLDVSGNGLGTKRPNDKENKEEFSKKIKLYLIEAFKSLKQITLLNISQNDLHNLTPQDFIQVIFSFPEQIKEILISERDIAKFSGSELTGLAKILYCHGLVLKIINGDGFICGAIGSVEILDSAFIPSMYSEEATKMAVVPFTLTDANSLAAQINLLITEMLFAQNFSISTCNILLEYLNIKMYAPSLRAQIPRLQILTDTLTQQDTSPPGSPVQGTRSPDLHFVSAAGLSPRLAGGGASAHPSSDIKQESRGAATSAAAHLGSATKYTTRRQGLFPPAGQDEVAQVDLRVNSCICS